MFSSEKNLEILKSAIDIYIKEYVDNLPEEDSEFDGFSGEFEKKMQNLIKQQKRFYYAYINSVGKRVACIILIICISMFSDSSASTSYQSLDITNLLVEPRTRTITQSEGMILRTRDKSNEFSVITTGDSYYCPQILEVNFI